MWLGFVLQRFRGLISSQIPTDMDTFENMAKVGVEIVDRVVVEEMKGIIDIEKNVWVIPMR